MLGVTYTLRSWLLAIAPLAVCACILLASSSAEAMICSMEQVAQEEEMLSSTPLARDPEPPSVLTELRAPSQAPLRACTALDSEECRWSFPEGTPEPTRTLSLRRPLVALVGDSGSLPIAASTTCSVRTHDSGERDAYRARVFRPPRRQ